MPAMTFRRFWPLYLSLHRHPANRVLHVAGTVAAVGLLALAVWRRALWPVPAAVVVGYGAAWTGHALFEGNRPATFGHPLLSLLADLMMVARAMGLSGRAGVPAGPPPQRGGWDHSSAVPKHRHGGRRY
jgi:hypothetical protein